MFSEFFLREGCPERVQKIVAYKQEIANILKARNYTQKSSEDPTAFHHERLGIDCDIKENDERIWLEFSCIAGVTVTILSRINLKRIEDILK